MTEASIDTPGQLVVEPGSRPGIEPAEAGWGWPYIDLAALGINSRRSYVVALLRIVLLPVAFSVVVGLFAAWAVFGGSRHLPPIATIIAAFGYVISAGLAVVWSVTRTHRRSFLSLISIDLTVDWRRLAIRAGVQAALTLPLLFLARFITHQPWPSGATVPVLGLALLLIPLQAASEEILFRGYLTQALGRIFRSRAKIVVAVGIVFAALHLNAYGPLTAPYMFGVSLILSLVSLRDGGIELTIGAHTAWNWISVGEIGSIASRHPAIQITWPYLVVLVIQGVLFYGLTRLLVRLACDTRRTRTA